MAVLVGERIQYSTHRRDRGIICGDGIVLVHDVINMSFVGSVKSNSDTATVGKREISIRTVSVRQ